jgi:drug/metabolite transporter (DMT)-like permease
MNWSCFVNPAAHRAAPTALAVVGALLLVYTIWGTTYLAIRFALEGYAPMYFPAIRYIAAGAILYAVLRLRGARNPGPRQWLNAAVMGFLMLGVGNGGVVLAERSVGSGLAATAVATVPLWAGIFAGIWGNWPRRMQWAGMAIGFCGIAALGIGSGFSGNPVGALMLLAASVCWSLGSVWGRHMDLPHGFMSSAAQMLAGGVELLAASALRGEHWTLHATPRAEAAVLYLIVFGSLVGYSAFMYLVQNVSPALASSYAYVNPVIAVIVGVLLGGESIGGTEYLAIAMVVAGVALIVYFNRAPPPPPRPAQTLEKAAS